MAESTVRWGIIGTAGIAEKVSVALAEASNATCVAVASRDKDKAEKFIADNCPGARAYGSYQELLDDDEVQVVYIPLPTGLRLEWVLKAAEKKKHVLCEKPIAANLGDARKMVDACQAAGVQFMDNTMFLLHDRTTAMRAVLDDEELFGTPNHVISTFSLPLGNFDFFKDNIRLNRNMEPYGVLGDLGWYCARFSLWAFRYEDPESVSCEFLEETSDGVPVTLAANLMFKGGRTASFTCSFKQAWRQWAEVVGPKCALRVEDFVIPAEIDVSKFTVTRGSVSAKALTFPNEVVKEEAIKGCQQHTKVVEKLSDIAISGNLEEFWPKVAIQTQMVLSAMVTSARRQTGWVQPRERTKAKPKEEAPKGKGKGKSKKGEKGTASEEAEKQFLPKKPHFTRVGAINPGSSGVNLEVKVLSIQKAAGEDSLIAIVGDASGVIKLIAQGEAETSKMKEGADLVIRNASVKMTKGFVHLQVGKWGKVETSKEEFNFVPNEKTNISDTEYELVPNK
ncbi:unnamed protein product [Polarella glacialis]|uniref:Gfo/Idh/MocA-like oxidoreductase N-terminal domain-containing protein n=1 Tax=Polarella glacialis TaxID=89957 RepID=A0A813DPJ0_POLGL|nr:unnamed protein product [Polarella glacialis]CAE8708690.1 unnamed protein product [Polarella glacialis]